MSDTKKPRNNRSDLDRTMDCGGYFIRAYAHMQRRHVCTLLTPTGVSRNVLVRNKLEAIMPLIVGQHHGNAIGKWLILQGNRGALSALVGPDRADARPDFLPTFRAASGFPVVDKVSRCVWHILPV